MKNTLLLIISILVVQSAWGQKVDWNKPLYTISVSINYDLTTEDFNRLDDWIRNSKEGEDLKERYTASCQTIIILYLDCSDYMSCQTFP